MYKTHIRYNENTKQTAKEDIPYILEVFVVLLENACSQSH